MRVRTVVPVVALLGVLAACGGEPAPADDDALAGADVTVDGTDSLAFEPSEVTVEGGATIGLACGSAVNHTFVIEETDETVVACEAGSAATGSIDLEAGSYVFYCDVPGHRTAGMEGTLTVEGG